MYLDMYVDVTERQTGKTYRLIENMFYYLKQDKKNIANIVSPNQDYLDDLIMKIITHKYYNKKFTTRIIFSLKMIKVGNVRNYVDEFDFIKKDKIFIDKNAYYCTSLHDHKEISLNIIDTFNNRRKEKIDNILKFI